MSELRKGPPLSLQGRQHRSHTANVGSMSLRSPFITGIEALEVDTLTYNYRRLSEQYRTADRAMTDFKERSHCLKVDMDRLDDNTNIKLASHESQTQYELDSSSRDLMAGLSHELAVKQSLEMQLSELTAQLTKLRDQVEETTSRVNYLEDFCGTRRLK